MKSIKSFYGSFKDNWKEVKPFYVNKYKGKLTLDVGCGESKYGDVGVDIDLISDADVIADAHNLPFKSNVFDTIILFDILEHSTYYGKILDEAKRVSKDKAIFLISTTYGDIYSADECETHRHTYTLVTLKQTLKYHNLSIIEIHRYCPLLDNIICVAIKR